MSTPEPAGLSGALFGRERECTAIDQLLGASAHGESTSLVLRGEAGIGKTALLSYAAERGGKRTVLRIAGVEAESDLGFAGLEGLLRPITGKLDELPRAQEDALSAALGFAPSGGSDRLLVCAAALSLLAAAAEDQPVLCLVDDVQFLDVASVEALLFSARRLGAEPVAMLFVVREGAGREVATPGLPEVVLEGVDADDRRPAPQGKRSRRGRARARVATRASRRKPSRSAGVAEWPERAAAPGSRRSARDHPFELWVTGAFLQRVERLPAETQAALLIAALDDRDEVATVMRASDEAGLPADALDAAEHDGLLRIADGAVEFRHPLVRSALLESSTHSQRRAGHAALAAALSADQHADRRVWHQALASVSADEEVAAALEASARRYESRAGHASAATAFARAAELSSSDGSRMRRLAAAAQAAWAAGQPDQARDLIARVLPLAPDGLRAELLYLRGVIEARTSDLRGAIAVLVEAAETSESPSLALDALSEATEAANYAGEYAQGAAIAARAGAIEPDDEIDRFRVSALTGMAAELAGDHERAEGLVREAIQRGEQLQDPGALVWASLLATMGVTGGNFADGLPHSSRAVAIARERGLLSMLPLALWAQANALVGLGRFNLARSAAEEGIRLASDFGHRSGASWNLIVIALLDSLRGDESAARGHLDEAVQLAAIGGGTLILAHAEWMLGLLDLTAGKA